MLSSVLILTVVASLSLLHLTEAGPWHAAKCLTLKKNCSRRFSRPSRFCKSHISAWWQPKACRRVACNFCSINPQSTVCGTSIIAKLCKNVEKPKPTKKPATPPTTPQGSCSWRDNGRKEVVIPIHKAKKVKGWSYVKRGQFSGYIYEKNRKGGMSKPGTSVMCYRVRIPHNGKYYMNAISYAPHNTEHNDAFVSSSVGFELWRRGRYGRNVKPNEMIKAYQNQGKSGVSYEWKHIDFNGHRLIIPHVKKGQVVNICMGGRSYKYEVYKIMLRLCAPGEKAYCTGLYWKVDLEDIKDSKCV